MRSACRSAAGLPPWARSAAYLCASLRALRTEMSGKRPMRIMREEPPPRGRYWNQNVLEPLARMRTPKPLTAPSQRKVCPVLGARARCTAASVRFFVMDSPTAYRQRFAPQIPSGVLQRNMAGYVGKSRQLGGMSHVLYG